MAVSLSHVRLFFAIPTTPRVESAGRRLEMKFKAVFHSKLPVYFHEFEFDEEDTLLILETLKHPDEKQIAEILATINKIVEEL